MVRKGCGQSRQAGMLALLLWGLSCSYLLAFFVLMVATTSLAQRERTEFYGPCWRRSWYLESGKQLHGEEELITTSHVIIYDIVAGKRYKISMRSLCSSDKQYLLARKGMASVERRHRKIERDKKRKEALEYYQDTMHRCEEALSLYDTTIRKLLKAYTDSPPELKESSAKHILKLISSDSYDLVVQQVTRICNSKAWRDVLLGIYSPTFKTDVSTAIQNIELGTSIVSRFTESLLRASSVTKTEHGIHKRENMPRPLRGKYIGLEDGHWIKRNNSGKTIILEDGSVWSVQSIDRADAMLWLQVTDITVKESNSGMAGYNYLLINTDDDEKVHAKYLGKE